MNKFNFNIDIEDKFEDNQLLSKQKPNIKTQMQEQCEHSWVDLKLPSKTLWHSYNLGVDFSKLNVAEGWFGNYYAWGETEPKKEYTEFTYKFSEPIYETKRSKRPSKVKIYEYKSMKLLPKDDAATVKFNDKNIHIPTLGQFNELKARTRIIYKTNYKDIPGLDGLIFANKTDSSRYIFIPAAGYYYPDYDEKHQYTSRLIIDDGEYKNCTFWLANARTDKNFVDNMKAYAYCFEPYSWGDKVHSGCRLYRYWGMPIRPVLNQRNIE